MIRAAQIVINPVSTEKISADMTQKGRAIQGPSTNAQILKEEI